MGATAEELRLDIEAKRAELGEDLEALGQHVAPAQIAQRKGAEYAAKIRDGVQGLIGREDESSHAGDDRVAGGGPPANPSIAENPLAVAAISIFVGVVLGSFLSRRRARRRARRG